ncbi:hypothetical protein [Amycolatopsis sp. cmx-4-54]|uniref:hypothetical protein n=1 Tax=Amycolatopsis sp. cmx-4-54 TaxID=2790936 RepID=UPI00397A2D0E
MTTAEVATTNQTAPAEQKVVVPLVGQLTDLDQAYRYSAALAQSSLLPKDLIGKPSNVLAIILYGQQLALTPMQSIQSIYVVNGRPSMSGQLWLSKVREAGHKAFVPCADCGEANGDHAKNALGHRYKPDHDPHHCTVTIVRGDDGETHTETFTWDEAVAAKLTNKDVWKSYPKRMLLWRAVSNCATIICPEVALGFGDEVDESELAKPTLGQVVAEREDRAAEQRAETAPEAEVVDAETVEPEPAAADIGPTADEYAELAEAYERPTEGLFDPDAEQ